MIIVLKNANFASKNIGQVEIPTSTLLSIRIDGANSVEGLSSSYKCYAVYDDNSERDVTSLATWTIADDTYATISNGVLSIKSTAESETVQISAAYGSMTANKSVVVTFADTISSDAQAILTVYGDKTLSSEQRHAFDDFYTEFTSKGWTNIEYMLIPILHNETSEVLDTFTKVNSTNVGYNVITGNKVTLVEPQVYGSNYGIVKIGDYGIQKDLNNSSSFVTNFKIGFSTSGLTAGNLCVLYGFKRVGNNAMQIIPRIDTNAISYGAPYSAGILTTPAFKDQQPYTERELNGVIRGCNISGANSGDYIAITYDNTAKTNVVSGTIKVQSDKLSNTIGQVGVIGGSNQTDGGVGFIAVGEAFTNNQDFKDFAEMVLDLMNVLWGNTQTSNNESSGNETNQ